MVRDVEPVQQPVTGELEVVVRAPGRSALGSRRRRSSRAPGSSSESRAWRAAGSARYAATRAACWGEPPPEIRDAPRIRPSSFTVGRPVHCARVDEEVTRGDDRGAGEGHVLPDHRGVVVAAAAQVVHQLLVAQRVGIDRLDLVVGLHGGRLANLVPLLRLVAPQLALEHVRGALDAVGEGLGRHRHHLPVGEPVGVGGHPGLERDAVERHHVAVPEAERPPDASRPSRRSPGGGSAPGRGPRGRVRAARR